MKKALKVAAFLAALVLIGILVYLVDLFTGYPVSYFRVQHAARAYMEEQYPNTDYELSSPSYSLKLGGFQFEVTAPDSTDDCFQLDFYRNGALKYDTYVESVVNRTGTALRLSQEYRKRSREVFDQSNFPYAAQFSSSFDEAIAGGSEERGEPGTYPSKWNTKELELDKEYDISSLSGEYGTVNLTVTSRDVSLHTAAESLLRLKEIMEKANLPFKSAELWILSEETDEFDQPTEQLHILNFGWDDIYEEGMEERVQSAIDATNAYYNQ